MSPLCPYTEGERGKSEYTYGLASKHYHKLFFTIYYFKKMSGAINFLKVDSEKHHFTEENLPALIHYKCKEGGSNYSMVLIENLVLRGSKALILTGYPAAKDQFFNEAATMIKKTAIIETLDDIEKDKDKQVLIIHDDDENLCLETIKILEDIQDRIIFIKNINIFHEPLIKECLKHDNIILSGDLDSCSSKEIIIRKPFTSVILFSQPEIEIEYKFIPLEHHTGYIRSSNKEGYVKSIK